MGSEVILENSHTAIKFEPEKGYALVELINKDTGRSVNLRGKGEGLSPCLWKMNVINGNEKMTAPASGVEHVIESGETGKTLMITWSNVEVTANDRQGKMTVVAKFFLPENDSIAKCSLDFRIDGKPAPWIRSVAFPYLSGIETLGDDYFINCASIGRIVRDPTRRMLANPERCGKLCYPGWSMQFVAFYGSNQLNANNLVDISQGNTSKKGKMTDEFTGAVVKDGKYDKVNGFYRGTALDETGLYVACEDGDFYYKECVSGRLPSQKDSFNVEFLSYMSFPFWPQNSKKNADTFIYEMPYQFAIGVYSGGMPQACDRYRQWAVNQKWMRRGKVNSNSPDNDVSPTTKKSTIWGYGGESPAYYVPNVLAVNDYYKVPMANHWAAWYAVPFDFDNPEYWPTEPHLAQALKELSDIGINSAG